MECLIVPPDSYRDDGSFSIKKKFQLGVDKKLNRLVVIQVCDATKLNQGTEARLIIIIFADLWQKKQKKKNVV